MKPYGLRPGDGGRCCRHYKDAKYQSKYGSNKFDSNKFTKRLSYEMPRGKNKEAKLHRERCLVHRQARSDAKKEILKELKGNNEET